MKTLIFEGIATSGKSTVVNKLVNGLPKSLKVVVADEEVTHVPIMEQRNELHIDFFENLITKLVSNKPDILLIDRLYMTQAFRAKCRPDEYKKLEHFLLEFNAITIFLKVDEKAISKRVQKATGHRNPEWAAYVKSRNEEGKYADYYISQQRSQLKLLKESTIPYKIFNTTGHDYKDVVKELIYFIQK
jgi:thymidylate kinase